jgi:DNA polymerase-3 subunit delta'
VLLMVSHSPGRLLATIRSRCRRLAFAPPGIEATAAFVRARADANPEEALRLAHMAEGAPGKALQLAAAQALTMDDAARELIAGLPQIDETRALSLAERFRGGEGPAQFSLLFERLADRVHALAADRAAQGIGRLDRWAGAWETLQRLPREVEALNLDRADALFTALAELRQAAQS